MVSYMYHNVSSFHKFRYLGFESLGSFERSSEGPVARSDNGYLLNRMRQLRVLPHRSTG